MNRMKFLLGGICFVFFLSFSQSSYGQTSQFIPIDSANKMIQSYLNSITSGGSEPDLHSIIFNADSLRSMLDNESNGRIASVKIMFAHTLNYVNGGGANTNCGYKSGSLTLVIAGFDANGDYVFYPAEKALNIGRPCPPSCPSNGTASNDLLTTQ